MTPSEPPFIGPRNYFGPILVRECGACGGWGSHEFGRCVSCEGGGLVSVPNPRRTGTEIVNGPALAAAVRRWDAIAIRQLAQAAVALAEENETLRMRADFAEDCAVMWERTAEAERDGWQIGLTMNGAITTIDDDAEYR